MSETNLLAVCSHHQQSTDRLLLPQNTAPNDCLPHYLFTSEANMMFANDHQLHNEEGGGGGGGYPTDPNNDESNTDALMNNPPAQQSHNNYFDLFSCSTPMLRGVEEHHQQRRPHQQAQQPATPLAADALPNTKLDNSSLLEFEENELKVAAATTTTPTNMRHQQHQSKENNPSGASCVHNESTSSLMRGGGGGGGGVEPIGNMERLLNNLQCNYELNDAAAAAADGSSANDSHSANAHHSFVDFNPSSERHHHPHPHHQHHKQQQQQQHKFFQHSPQQQQQQQLHQQQRSHYGSCASLKLLTCKVNEFAVADASFASTSVSLMEQRLDSEMLRRQHCERQISELNKSILELQQQLAVANGLEKKRRSFAQSMSVALQKVFDSFC